MCLQNPAVFPSFEPVRVLEPNQAACNVVGLVMIEKVSTCLKSGFRQSLSKCLAFFVGFGSGKSMDFDKAVCHDGPILGFHASGYLTGLHQ
jgi:hypothetical protein